MKTEEVQHHNYVLELPPFEGLRFTEVSDGELDFLTAMKFVWSQRAVLPSAAERAMLEIEATTTFKGWNLQPDLKRRQLDHLFVDNCIDYSFKNSPTRTGIFYFREGGRWYVAFDDYHDPEKNILLARTREYQTSRSGVGPLLPKSDKLIADMLKRAELTDRIVEFSEPWLEVATKTEDGKSPFGTHPLVKAFFGYDVGEQYAAFLRRECWGDFSVVSIELLPPIFFDDKGPKIPREKILIQHPSFNLGPIKLHGSPLSYICYAIGVLNTYEIYGKNAKDSL